LGGGVSALEKGMAVTRVAILTLVLTLWASADSLPKDGPALFLPRAAVSVPVAWETASVIGSNLVAASALQTPVPAPSAPTTLSTCPYIQTNFTLQPPSTLLDVIPKVHGLSYWQIDILTSYSAPCLLYYSMLSMQPGAPQLLSQASALLNLQGAIQKSGWAKAAAVIRDVVMFAGPAFGIIGLIGFIPINTALSISTAAGGVTAYGPQIVSDLMSQAPSASGLLPQLQYPVTLQPGVWVTDYEFSARLSKQQMEMRLK